ncbi:unnamed protein product [Arctogadus glacialis]
MTPYTSRTLRWTETFRSLAVFVETRAPSPPGCGSEPPQAIDQSPPPQAVDSTLRPAGRCSREELVQSGGPGAGGSWSSLEAPGLGGAGPAWRPRDWEVLVQPGGPGTGRSWSSLEAPGLGGVAE